MKPLPIMVALLERILANYSPNRDQAVDEAFQGRSSLKQYLPTKPVKWGIKVWCRADSHNGYMSKLKVSGGRRSISVGGWCLI